VVLLGGQGQRNSYPGIAGGRMEVFERQYGQAPCSSNFARVWQMADEGLGVAWASESKDDLRIPCTLQEMLPSIRRVGIDECASRRGIEISLR
jgi:hypothetical protein